jgi:hypothetical protein
VVVILEKRYKARQGTLSEEKITRLKSVGFVFDGQKAREIRERAEEREGNNSGEGRAMIGSVGCSSFHASKNFTCNSVRDFDVCGINRQSLAHERQRDGVSEDKGCIGTTNGKRKADAVGTIELPGDQDSRWVCAETFMF